MSGLAIPTQSNAVETYQQSSIERLERFARTAVVVRQMLEGVIHTTFVPKAYRGKLDEATAAVLAGSELDLDLFASLRAFDDIQGTPAPKALTLRSIVQSKGHDIVVVEESATRAIVKGRRKGSDEWQTSEWTIERATAAGYVAKNPNYKTKPAEMLVARATAQVCRWVASDAIMGMPYAAEEIGDATGIQPRSVTGRGLVSAGDIVGAAVRHSESTIDALDADEVLARIRVAETQADLDGIRQLCEDANLRDERVVAAWKLKYFEIGGGADE